MYIHVCVYIYVYDKCVSLKRRQSPLDTVSLGPCPIQKPPFPSEEGPTEKVLSFFM